MNLLAARVVLRPRGLADVLDLALPFCASNLRPLGLLSLVLLGPIAAAAAYLRIRHHMSWQLLWLVIAGATCLVEGAFTVALGDLLFRESRQVAVLSVIGRFVRRYPTYLMAFIGRQVIYALSTALIVLPLFVAPAYLLVHEAVLLESASLGQAFTRSRALQRNHTAFCFGLWLATLAIPVLGALVFDVLGDAVVGFVLQLGQPAGDLGSHGGSGYAVVGALLGVPVAAAARFLGYIDLRTRKEGWDIQLRFMALVQDAGSDARRAA